MEEMHEFSVQTDPRSRPRSRFNPQHLLLGAPRPWHWETKHPLCSQQFCCWSTESGDITYSFLFSITL